MKKTILFDFDGVIINTFDNAFAVSRMIYPTLTLEEYHEKWNGNINHATWPAEKAENPPDFQMEFGKLLKDIEIDPAKKQVLVELSEHFDFHIISSTDSQTLKTFCETNDIHHYFGDILGRDVHTSKVVKFQAIFKKYKLNPHECIFVTDTVGDIEEARASGVGTIIAVADGYQRRETLESAQPTCLIDSIVDLPGVVY